jgi:catechol 2,3-dioxygenase-like lactoylglutathione lyase family enzyme
MSVKFALPDYVVVIVSDLDASLHFYTGVLGLELGHRSGGFAQLRTGATRLALYEREAMARTLGYALRRPDPDAPGFELGFKVTDCDAAWEALLARGAVPASPPTTRAWGQRTAYVRDPDGHLIELAQDLPRAGSRIP